MQNLSNPKIEKNELMHELDFRLTPEGLYIRIIQQKPRNP